MRLILFCSVLFLTVLLSVTSLTAQIPRTFGVRRLQVDDGTNTLSGLTFINDNSGSLSIQTNSGTVVTAKSSGNFDLPLTTGPALGIGSISQGGVRFIHSFGTNNFFAGANAGNLSNSGTGNTGVGSQSLSTVSTGNNNTAIGASTGNAIINGTNNTFVGANTNAVSDLSNATAIGAGAVVAENNSIILGTVAPATRVGIGVTAPNTTLDVQGSLSMFVRAIVGVPGPITTSDYILLYTDNSAGPDQVLTLPPATPGRVLIVKNLSTVGNRNVAVTAPGSVKIDNAPFLPAVISSGGNLSRTFVSDGVNWFIVSN